MKIREEREDKQLDIDVEADSEKNLKARHFRYWRWIVIFFVLISIGLIFYIEFIILTKTISKTNSSAGDNGLNNLLFIPPLAAITLIILFVLNSVFKQPKRKNKDGAIDKKEISDYIRSYLLVERLLSR